MKDYNIINKLSTICKSREEALKKDEIEFDELCDKCSCYELCKNVWELAYLISKDTPVSWNTKEIMSKIKEIKKEGNINENL